MTTIIAFNAFRRDAAKSNFVASMAFLLAQEGLRIGVVDMDLYSPKVHRLFTIERLRKTWNSYLWGEAMIEEAVYDVSQTGETEIKGSIYLAPLSPHLRDILRVLHEGIAKERVLEGFAEFAEAFDLDYLLIDTASGLNEDSLSAFALADMLFAFLDLAEEDFVETGVMVDVSRKLGVKEIFLVVNNRPRAFDVDQIRSQIKKNYACEIAAIVPHTSQLFALATPGIFAQRYPQHPLTQNYQQIARRILQRRQ